MVERPAAQPQGNDDVDDKALRNARKNLVGGAILLPIALLILIAGLSQGRLSFLWVGIAAACVIYMVRSYQQLQAAKLASRVGASPGLAPSAAGWQAAAPVAPPQVVAAPPLPAPGWYRDPTGQTRWWDGDTWTQHVTPQT
jgi:hypothetical protein